MKLAKALLIALLMSASLASDASLALKAIAGSHPCGKIICCCPEMCKKIKKGAQCHSVAALSCGASTMAAAPTGLFADSSAEIAMLPMGSPILGQELRAVDQILPPDVQYASFILIPLDKPPTSLA